MVRRGRAKGFWIFIPFFCQWLLAYLLQLALALTACAGESKDWPVYLGDNERTHFSPLKQINAKNVARLQVAWTYHSGDAPSGDRSQIQCNPLIIGGVLYGTSPELKLLALDAATGKELWRFDPSDSSGVNQIGRAHV